MTVFSAMNVGRSDFCAASIAFAMPSRSLAVGGRATRSSRTLRTAWETSSLKARYVWPSMVMPFVVVDEREVVELEVPGERRGLARQRPPSCNPSPQMP